ncbi:hypothetical protein [Legionella longbeachae]|uniref:Uncharacterized protein n=1 Tax=Legionella longbeachae serogroup 1 (strain NSW150) TaxID=661367 RepID=D3HNF4_LEGLN|nr:hypothetical protein [Legionella longbeachae]VEE00945.1 Uncharacterised protein [Legionella oakridgensis]HBD7399059.1 hypothetical protein [Legionella pneumophila]EEZ96595.1 hypothetical protein LLB_1791 [Legionella longbeachae D-4968]UAK47445.1 hypothetical protein K8O86_04445 [Legionella longbeachae]CBJ10417.1 hypothetical protein LLO_0092 [Legionella longbeachae NSW150]
MTSSEAQDLRHVKEARLERTGKLSFILDTNTPKQQHRKQMGHGANHACLKIG